MTILAWKRPTLEQWECTDATHMWDPIPAYTTVYTPSAAERAAWAAATNTLNQVDLRQRVDAVKDLGSGHLDFKRDQGFYGPVYTFPNLPGPLWIPTSPRFNGRPCVKFDNQVSGQSMGAVLSPNPIASITEPSYWFNPPNGFSPPFTFWNLVQGEMACDATLGSDGTGPTCGLGAAIMGGKAGYWGYADWGLNVSSPPKHVKSNHRVLDTHETVLVIGQTFATPSGWLQTTRRRGDGRLITERTTIQAIDPYSYKEMFMGWVDDFGYWSGGGIRAGIMSETDLAKLVQWASPYIPPAQAFAAEPVTEIFYDDWETGNNSKWVTVTGAPPVSSASAFTGSNGVKLSPANSDKSLGCSTTKWTQSGRPYFSFVGRFRMNTLPAAGTTASLFTIQNIAQAANVDFFIEQSTRRLFADLQGPIEVLDTGINPIVGHWYTVQIKAFFGGATFWMDLKVDGIQFPRLLSLGHTATSTRTLRVGPVGLTNQTWDADFDDVKIVVDNIDQGWIT